MLFIEADSIRRHHLLGFIDILVYIPTLYYVLLFISYYLIISEILCMCMHFNTTEGVPFFGQI